MKGWHWLPIILLYLFFPAPGYAQKKVPILVYHSIDEYKGSGERELYVSPEAFRAQVKYLKEHGFTLLTFERWNELDRADKPVFLTFDDGYKNNRNVYSIFKSLKNGGFSPSATLFVISDFIGWSNRLSARDLRELADSGMFSIQSHTATHQDLVKVRNYRYELKGSRDAIERITGRPVLALAYPYGSFDKRTVEETRKYYKFGLTTTPGPYIEQGYKVENFLLPRIYIKNSTTLKDFERLVNE